jgi:hypothetical protein
LLLGQEHNERAQFLNFLGDIHLDHPKKPNKNDPKQNDSRKQAKADHKEDVHVKDNLLNCVCHPKSPFSSDPPFEPVIKV